MWRRLISPMTSRRPPELFAMPSTKFQGNPTMGCCFHHVWPQCDWPLKVVMIPSIKFYGNPTTGSLFDLVWPRWPQCDLEQLLRSHPPSFTTIWQLEVYLTLYDPTTSMWPRGFITIPSTMFHGNLTTGKFLCMTMVTPMWHRKFIAIPSTKFHGNSTSGTLFDLKTCRVVK
jgi:hypothetical protein